jgi:hypothetical protein
MDWNNLQVWQYGALIGGAVTLIGLVVYFLPIRRAKVPGNVLTAVGAGALGLAVGVVWMAGFGYSMNGPESTPSGEVPTPKDAAGPAAAAKTKGGQGKGGFAKGGAPKGGNNPPTPRTQLASLVTTLDTLVDRPITLTLTPEDRAAIAERLKGLDAADEIKEDDAKARLEAILKVLEKDRKALEAVGYRWPSPDAKGPPKGGFGGPKDSPNPFSGGTAKEHLKSLQERLEKK